MNKELFEIIKSAENVVFFGGAGVSTESNIPDFRSENGLYKAKQEFGRSPEEMLSHSFFVDYTKTFYEYYRKNLIYLDAKPNRAHIALAKLEEIGKLKAIVTQNIDGLHQKAGSKVVYEIHGTTLKNECTRCNKKFNLEYIMDKTHDINGVPKCDRCGGTVKPEVVLYEECLDDKCVSDAVNAIAKADTLIIGGTSLVVYPAASFVEYFRGKNLVLINKQATAKDRDADLVLHESLGDVLDLSDQELNELEGK